MTANPLVTVLMAVYNGEEYLKTSVPCILNQTYKNLELLIVNDCSTDGSVKIIKSFNDKRVVIHDNEKNLGQTKSLNIGIKMTRGKYIARMDADDIAFPFWIEKLVYFMEKHPEYAVVGPGAVVINADSKIENVIFSPDNHDAIISRIFFDTPLNHVGSLMNREAIINVGTYNELFLIKQDYELWSSLIRKKRSITSISDLLVAVRVHEKSLTAVESNKGIKEFAQTVYENIKCLTNLNITFNDAFNLARLRLKPHTISTNEFNRTIEVFVKIYENLKYSINQEKLEKYIKSVIIKTYCTRALMEIDSHQLQEGRKTSLDCLIKYGFTLIPFTIFLSSFLGERSVHWISEIYRRILRIRARYILYAHNVSLK